MEERVKVEPVQIKFKCPECIDGYQNSTGNIFTTTRSYHEHICDNSECGYKMSFEGKSYPYIDYQEIK